MGILFPELLWGIGNKIFNFYNVQTSMANLSDSLITSGARTTRVLSRLFFSPGGSNVGVPRTVCDGSLIIVSFSLDTC